MMTRISKVLFVIH